MVLMPTGGLIPSRMILLDSATRDWNRRIRRAGGSASWKTLRNLDACIRGLKNDNVWSKIDYLHLFCGDEKCLSVPIKGDTAVSLGFVEAGYVERGSTGGLAFSNSGSSMYLSTNLKQSVFTPGNQHIGVYENRAT